MRGCRPTHHRTARKGAYHQTAMRTFAPISKPAAPACAPQLQSRREREPGHRLSFGCLVVTRTERAIQLTAAQGAIQLRMHTIAATRGQGGAAGPASRKGSQARRSPDPHRRATQTSKITTLARGKLSHTSLIPSTFRVKRRGSAQREQHDRIQASWPSLNTFVFIRRWVCRCKSSTRQSTTTSQQMATGSMHPLGATWNQMGINRRSKQVVYADDERTIDRQWTHIHRALSSSHACRQKPPKQTCEVVNLPVRAPTSRQARDDPPGTRGSSAHACAYRRHG